MQVNKRYFAFFAVALALLVLASGCTTTAPVSTAAPVTAQVTSAATPNLVGIWTGTTIGHTRMDGFRESNTTYYNISAQKGPAFSGSMYYTRANGITYHENFSGVIARDGRISIVGHGTGILTGQLLGPDEVEFTLLQPGEDAKAFIMHLNRQKS
jgi:hypothetical protein